MSRKPSIVRKLVTDKMMASPHLPDAAFMAEFGCSRRLVSYVRSELVKSGKIPGGRRASLPMELAEALMVTDPALAAPTSPPPTLPSSPSDILALAENLTEEDDEATRKELLRKVRAIALDPAMHPDTVLSAAQAYIKLKDAVKAKSLGPGKPMNRESAVTRLTALLTAVGPNIALTAFEHAFKGLLNNAIQPSGAEEPLHSKNTTPEASGPAGA